MSHFKLSLRQYGCIFLFLVTVLHGVGPEKGGFYKCTQGNASLGTQKAVTVHLPGYRRCGGGTLLGYPPSPANMCGREGCGGRRHAAAPVAGPRRLISPSQLGGRQLCWRGGGGRLHTVRTHLKWRGGFSAVLQLKWVLELGYWVVGGGNKL